MRAMNPIVFVMRRPITTLILVIALASGGVVGLSKMRADSFRSLNTPEVHATLGSIGMSAEQMKAYIVGQFESYFRKHEEQEQSHHEQQKIIVTSPKAMDVTLTQPYVCQIHSRR